MVAALQQAEQPHGHSRLANLVALVCAVLAMATFVALALHSVSAARHGVNKFQDDAFYYVLPAKHFVDDGRFTFDGRTPTNGFHPLWMGVTVAMVAATGTNAAPETHVFALNLIENLLRGLAVATCLVLGWRATGALRVGYLAIPIFLLYPAFIVFEQGMETTLAVLLYVLAIHAFLDDRLRTLGLLLAALFLCRLDTALFIGLPLAAWCCLRSPAPWSRRIWAIAPVLVSLVAATLLYKLATGLTVPISGAIKSSFPTVTWHGSYFVEPFNIVALYGWGTFRHGINMVMTLGVLLPGMLLVALCTRPAPLRARLLVVGLTGLLLLANLLLFQKWEKSVDPRYYALPMTAAAFMLGTGLAQALGRWAVVPRAGGTVAGWRNGLALLPALIVALMLGSHLADALQRVGPALAVQEDRTRAIFEAVSAALPRDAVIAGTDVGALAFWTQRRVVNLDGLMNDVAYQGRLRDRELAAYLREQGVTHVASGLFDAEQTYTGRPPEPMYRSMLDPVATRGGDYDCHPFYVYSYVYGVYSDRLCLRKRDEAFRRVVDPPGQGTASYVVWRLPPQ